MKKNLHLNRVLCALAILAAGGCSDDSSISTGEPTETCGGQICADPEVCQNDRCVVEIALGDDCSAENAVCKTGHCDDATKTCVECSYNAQCDKGFKCDDATKTCVKDEKTCTDNAQCDKGFKCDDATKTCVVDPDAGKIPLGEACTPNDTCAEGVCLDGVCTLPPDTQCASNFDCERDQYCDLETHQCEALPALGEACMEIPGCQGILDCVNNVCIDDNVFNGGACDDNILLCVIGRCVDGVCVDDVRVGDVCDATHICEGDDRVCIDGVCAPVFGLCNQNDDCGNDSYCCLSDDCPKKNACIAYKDGDIDDTCRYKTIPGLFEAAIQCEWKAPAEGDAYPNHANVLMTPLVMKTPHDTGSAQAIIFTTYNNGDGGAPSGQGSDIRYYGVIRIIHGETCALMESIFDDDNHIIGGSNLAMADVDGDGFVEIFAGRGQVQNAGSGGGIVAFHWDVDQNKYVRMWATPGSTTGWGGPAIHDLNDDGIPEILGSYGEVYDSRTGARVDSGAIGELSVLTTLGDFDGDGAIEAIGTSSIYRWNDETKQWVKTYANVRSTSQHMAYADFGTPIEDGTFDFDHFDGIAETAGCGGGVVEISTLTGQKLLRVTGMSGGGPCTIGDFDGDGRPEVATAFGDAYRVFDPLCAVHPEECGGKSWIWEKTSQDKSSASTGSSLFDFDGDGAMEAVYADECYTRVYDGKTGDVLFSAYHSSATWHEYPVIADVDNDESAEIIVSSNNAMGCATIDPIHRGLRCDTDEDCKSGVCVRSAEGELGLCRCTSTDQCNSRTDMLGNILNEYTCTTGLTAADQAGGYVCRASRNNAERVTGVRVMRDRLDRWMSSRNLWNQHVYTITNILDDMTIPKTVDWIMNFKATSPTLNNFRQNVQGASGANTAPDITGRFVGDVCQSAQDVITLNAVICNRGTKMVASLMPATFYKIDKNEDGSETRSFLCTSYTTANVPIGGCLPVSCQMSGKDAIGDIVIVVNDDGQGGKTTVECNANNNEARTSIDSCAVN